MKTRAKMPSFTSVRNWTIGVGEGVLMCGSQSAPALNASNSSPSQQMRASRTRSAFFSIFSVLALTVSTRAHAQGDSLVATTVNDDQMKRGFTVFNKVCLECHTKS